MHSLPRHWPLSQRLENVVRCAAFFVLAGVRPLWADGQAAAEPAKEGVVVLNPFVIQSDADVGYLAQSSLSGSRLNTNLGDLAVPTTAFTPEFIQDTGARSVEELVGYMTSTQVNYPEANQAFFTGDAAQLNIRGLSANSYAVNYFATTLRLDVYNTQRVDQSRGANSILFGLGSPGGVINIATNRAELDRSFGSVSMQGRYPSGLRTSFDFNQPLIPHRLSLRVDAVRDHGETWRQHEFDHQDRLYVTLHGKVLLHTSIDVEFEHGIVNKSIGSPSTAADNYTVWKAAGSRLSATANAAAGTRVISTANYLVFDTATGTTADWRGKTTSVANTLEGTQSYLTDFSLIPKDVALAAGPAFPQKTNYKRGSVFVTHSFTPNLHVELAGDAHDAPRDAINGASFVTLLADPNPTLPNGQPNPNAGRPYTEGFPVRNVYTDRAESLRFTASYTHDFGRIFGKHSVAVLGENDWSKFGNLQMRLYDVTNPFNTTAPENAANLLSFRTYLDLQGPATNLAAGDWRPAAGQTITETISGRKVGIDWVNYVGGSSLNRFYLQTAMGVLQSRFFDNRLVTVVGWRGNWEDAWYSPTNVRGPAVAPFATGPFIVVPGTTKTTIDAHTTTASAVFHVTRNLALTYNVATDFALPSTSGSTPAGRVPAPEGHSHDIGIKIVSGERVSLNALYFETSARKNYAAFTSLSPTNLDANINRIWSALGAAKVTVPGGGSASDQQVLSNGYTYDAVTKGYELELIANPTTNWRIFANFSYNRSTNTNLGRESTAYLERNRSFWLQGDNGRMLLDGSGKLAPVADDGSAVIDTVAKAVRQMDQLYHDYYGLADGQRPRGQVPTKWSVRTNYTFSTGWAKGIGVGGGVRYSGDPIVKYVQATPSAPTQLLYGPELTQADFNLSYRRPFQFHGHSMVWFTQLNIDNLADKTPIMPMNVTTTGQTITYRLVPPRQYSLLCKVSF